MVQGKIWFIRCHSSLFTFYHSHFGYTQNSITHGVAWFMGQYDSRGKMVHGEGGGYGLRGNLVRRYLLYKLCVRLDARSSFFSSDFYFSE